MRLVCHSTEGSTEKQEIVVAHVTTGCQSGYVCMVFYRRDGHVIELQQSNKWVRVPEEACQPQTFNPVILPYITLITAKPHLRPCPYLGRYIVTGLSTRPSGGASVVSDTETSITQCSDLQFQSLTVGCTEVNTMQFHSSCSVAETSTYSCHGSWEDNGTNYLIASPTSRKSVGARRFCFIYMATDTATAAGGDGGGGGSPLQVASVAESCKRNINPASSAEWAFNLTLNGT
ncbi:hypothetical protein B7P43_G03335 [Cryptotermes secundus]|uniref:Uncharacterized protein n=1 Tax=Cryptotermes secundus TaxID=105785 RepID=A0A2J7PR11_9NEOP|nr:hypothetical protein B7P43_G03335 [Cryptotermes secundus]